MLGTIFQLFIHLNVLSLVSRSTRKFSWPTVVMQMDFATEMGLMPGVAMADSFAQMTHLRELLKEVESFAQST